MLTQEKHWKDTDKIIEPQQGSHNLFIVFHDDVNPRSNTFIHQLCKNKTLTIHNHPSYDFTISVWLNRFYICIVLAFFSPVKYST